MSRASSLPHTQPGLQAIIREAECIGCAKCIKACPVDAILGSGKQMHTVIASECIGCELCIAPCPVDCIDMIPTEKKYDLALAQKRHQAKNNRLNPEEEQHQQKILAERKDYIQAALKRVKAKKFVIV